MSTPPDAATSIEVPDIEKAIELYRGFGFGEERIAAQLVRSGYPREEVTRRFPGVPDSGLPPSPQLRTRRARSGMPDKAAPAPHPNTIPQPTRSYANRVDTGVQQALTRMATARSAATQAPAHELPHKTTDPTDTTGVSFQYVPLIQCSFPHADPGNLASYTRRNGWLELSLSTARPDTGLPYGVPARLLTIFCASEAVRTRSPEIRLGASVHDFLRRLDVPITRGERGSLRVYANQLLRLAHCAITIDEHIRDANGRTGLHIKPCLFIQEAKLWWDDKAGVGEDSTLTLSPVLFNSILDRSAPLSTGAIKQLRKSPMDLDVYAWLVHRLFHLGKPSTLTWEQLSGQIGHNYGEIRYFRRFFGDSLKRVLKVYPQARVKVTEQGLTLLPSAPHIVRRVGADA